MSIQKIYNNLPAKLEDLTKFVLVGREKLVAVRAEIRAIENINLAREVTEQKREEARLIAEALLDAEAKIGSLLKHAVVPGRQVKTIPKPFTRDQSSQFQKMANNLDAIEEVKAEAKESNDLPTRKAVLDKIRERANKIINKNTKDEISYEDATRGLKDFIKQLKEVDKLSLGSKENDFLQRNIFEAIDIYINKFNTPSNKIQAAQNIIKHIKLRINESQQQSVYNS